MKIAVMSDLHVGLGSRAKDLCPVPPANMKKKRAKYNAKMDVAYREKFVNFVIEKGITAEYLLLPGDITDNSQPQEVEIASEFILQAATALNVPSNKVLFVPGNHDVDWTAYDSADTTGLRWSNRYEWIGHENFHFSKIINQGKGNVLASPHFIVWTFDDLIVVGYNSASHDSPVSKDVAHHGLADPTHLAEMCKVIESLKLDDAKIRILLVHHHPLDYPEPNPLTPDFSLMTNAEQLLNICHCFHFDLVIHGHKHLPRFETHSTLTYPHLPILCAGSFSVDLDTELAGTIDNQFHLVTINERAGVENLITGNVTSWTNNRIRGWRASGRETSGIDHIIPFGSYVMPSQLDATTEPYIREWLTTHDHILWKDVVRRFPELEYLPINSAVASFERIAVRLSRHSMYETQRDLILY